MTEVNRIESASQDTYHEDSGEGRGTRDEGVEFNAGVYMLLIFLMRYRHYPLFPDHCFSPLATFPLPLFMF